MPVQPILITVLITMHSTNNISLQIEEINTAEDSHYPIASALTLRVLLALTAILIQQAESQVHAYLSVSSL